MFYVLLNKEAKKNRPGMRLMLDLPQYFLVSLLVDWLGLKGTMTLDRAMSDREKGLFCWRC